MILNYKDRNFNIIINKKKSTRNTYIRVKDDLNIYVTTFILTSDREIIRLIEKNKEYIEKVIDKKIEEQEDEGFYYLGNKYEIVRINDSEISFGNTKVFIPRDMDEEDINIWYKIKAQQIFFDYFEKCYNRFNRKIIKPNLTIRKMKTRWGVCNTKLKRVTLNLELIKRPIECLEYVIIHELAHLIEANHSKRFWEVVSENYPNYKEVRKLLKK